MRELVWIPRLVDRDDPAVLDVEGRRLRRTIVEADVAGQTVNPDLSNDPFAIAILSENQREVILRGSAEAFELPRSTAEQLGEAPSRRHLERELNQ